jgi:hypothetical protein
MLFLLLFPAMPVLATYWNTPLLSIASFETNGNMNIGPKLPTLMARDFTIDMWIKPGSTQQTYANILDFNHRANIGMVFQQNGDDQNNFVFGLGNGSTTSYILYRLSANVWQHIAFERQGTTLRLYVNGNLVSTAGCFSQDIYYLPDSAVTIGYNINYGRYFSGSIKGLKFWDHAQSDSGIVADSLLHSTFAFNGSTDGLMLGNAITPKATGYVAMEMDIYPASTQQTYANIIDFNHRNGIGMVIQQNGNDVNNFGFCLANGSTGSGILYRLTPNVWQKIKFERNWSVINLYVNDKLVATQPCFSGNIYFLPNSNVTLGYNANYGRYFNGSIRNLRFNFAGTPAQISFKDKTNNSVMISNALFRKPSGNEAVFSEALYREKPDKKPALKIAPAAPLTTADPGAVWFTETTKTVANSSVFPMMTYVNTGSFQLCAVDISILYDPAILSVDASTWAINPELGLPYIPDSELTYIAVNPNIPGCLRIAGYGVDGKGPGSVPFVNINWKAKAPGTSIASIVVNTFVTDVDNCAIIGIPTGYSSTITVQ